MNFTNLSALFFLGLIPLIVLFHLIRPRPKSVLTSTLFLWKEILKEQRSTFRLSRLLRNISLILQIAAAIALTLALAKPSISRPAYHSGDIILVIDVSASMKAGAPGRTRFDEAKDRAMDVVNGLGEGGRMLVVEAGSKPAIRTFFTGNKELLRRAISDVRVTDAPSNIEGALHLAFSLMEQNRRGEVILISDGAYPTLDESIVNRSLSGGGFRFIQVGGGERNVGITQFAFRQTLTEASAYEIMATITNFTSEPVEVGFELFIDDSKLIGERVKVDALEEQVLIFPYNGLIAGVARAQLDVDDDFPTDNVAYAVLSASGRIDVLLVSRGNFFLENLLLSYPNVRLVKTDSAANLDESTLGAFSIVVFDGIVPPVMSTGNILLINTPGLNFPISHVGELVNPKVEEWNREHPITRNVDLSRLAISRALRVETEGGETLAEADGTPLIYAWQSGGIKLVYIGFDIMESDLPLRVAFPIMMSNAINWLYPDRLPFSSQQVRAGEPYAIYLKSDVRDVTFTGPMGERRFEVYENPFIFEETKDVGIYNVRAGDDERNFAVNLTNAEESDIVPKEQPTVIRGEASDREGKGERTEQPFWRYLAIAALGLVAVEWYFWSRRG
ncbi:MAG: vWA domain-containing protein [bacterium]